MSWIGWAFLIWIIGPICILGWVYGVQCTLELYRDYRSGRWR